MKIERALVVARKARIRRHIPSGATAQDDTIATPPKWPVSRDARGCFVKGGGGGPGRPPRDALKDAYIADLFAVWKKHGRQAIRQLCEETGSIFASDLKPRREQEAQFKINGWIEGLSKAHISKAKRCTNNDPIDTQAGG